MTAREILKLLHKDGWSEVPNRTKGSHVQLSHPTKPGKVTIPIHSGDIPLGTLKSIKKQAGIE
ncbi:MAG: type II toxin-antitoxin system HicA family toxin [Eubacteriales bacterium]|nr:type II toxin-antitoxin system HicA family toxin [Eubacteriales bacterium]